MKQGIHSQFLRKFLGTAIACIAILFIGSVGYWLIGNMRYSLLDCLYMTVITITTIGYGEIIDLSGNPMGRVFTIFIAFLGIGVLTYLLSNVTALIVEGDLTQTFMRKKMEKAISKLDKHLIVCGADNLGRNIVSELVSTKRPYIVIDQDMAKIEKLLDAFPDLIYTKGDATENNTLIKAGIERAQGLFAAFDDDNHNLVIILTAKQLHPHLRVVASCHDIKHIEKMGKAGADSVISPTLIGGLRMASEMIRPTVVSFLDIMLRDKDRNLRVDEIPVPERFVGKKASELKLYLAKYPNTLLLAIRTKMDWVYNPPHDYTLQPGSTLIVMTSPEERAEFLREN